MKAFYLVFEANVPFNERGDRISMSTVHHTAREALAEARDGKDMQLKRIELYPQLCDDPENCSCEITLIDLDALAHMAMLEDAFDVVHAPGLDDDGCELVACVVKDGRVEVL